MHVAQQSSNFHAMTSQRLLLVACLLCANILVPSTVRAFTPLNTHTAVASDATFKLFSRARGGSLHQQPVATGFRSRSHMRQSEKSADHGHGHVHTRAHTHGDAHKHTHQQKPIVKLPFTPPASNITYLQSNTTIYTGVSIAMCKYIYD